MTFSIWITFLVAAFLISISPGAGAVNSMSSGLRHGVRKSMPTILGQQFGYGMQIVLVGAGLGAIVASSNIALSIIKWMGVAYLVWLGIQKWRESPVEATGENPEGISKKQQFWNGAMVNLTNPKATIFLIALFPQFLVAGIPHGPQLATMGATLILVDHHGHDWLCPACQPAVSIPDHPLASATNEPDIRRSVCNSCRGFGEF